jgi:hypothetical protein
MSTQSVSDRRVIAMFSAAALVICAALGGVVWKVIPTLSTGQGLQTTSDASTGTTPRS